MNHGVSNLRTVKERQVSVLMESIEESAVQRLRVEFVRRLTVSDYVLDFLLQEGGISDLTYEDIMSRETRQSQATLLIDNVIRKSIVPLFIKGLECRNGHPYLARKLKQTIKDLREQEHPGPRAHSDLPSADHVRCESDFSDDSVVLSHNTISSGTYLPDPDATTVLGYVGTIQKDCDRCLTDGEQAVHPGKEQAKIEYVDNEDGFDIETDAKEPTENIVQQPRKVAIMDGKKKTLTKLHYHLKLMSHDGKKKEFSDCVTKYKAQYCRDSDVMLTLLDAEVESRRLVYDTDLHRGNIFDEMEKLLKTSSQPLAATMMFLARKGSARTMKESLAVGMEMLEDARALAERIEPCKDTGMVLYIQINILLQMYEVNPLLNIKRDIINKIDEAINLHFAESLPLLREDYYRMLYLKLVFCYLGIGLFGNCIEGCVTSEDDLRSAEACLKNIDSQQEKFDNRRKMFYYMAKSVLCRKRGNQRDALDFANMAEQKATCCGYVKELGPILELSGDLKEEVESIELQQRNARQYEIDNELNALLWENVLQKTSNQWGPEMKGLGREANRNYCKHILYCAVVVLLAFCVTVFCSY
ncbi:uncharacterized protein LOC124272271 [Haliotis rubra]|uniref:uncharacterized protein LOC124272271 n=1 Tax=Haliotis rubra TaxID=36100 RepID=UPI001EE4F592|nr:uncharacterized protein LOC124272271 [Haliotis rubra]